MILHESVSSKCYFIKHDRVEKSMFRLKFQIYKRGTLPSWYYSKIINK